MEKTIELIATISILGWVGLYTSVMLYSFYEVFKNLINKLLTPKFVSRIVPKKKEFQKLSVILKIERRNKPKTK